MKRQHLVMVLCVIFAVSLMTACAKTETQLSAAERLDLGEKYLLEMNYEQAVVQFRKLIEIEPKNPRAYTGLAEAYIGLGDIEKAVEALKQGLEQLPDSEELKTMLDSILPMQNLELGTALVSDLGKGDKSELEDVHPIDKDIVNESIVQPPSNSHSEHEEEYNNELDNVEVSDAGSEGEPIQVSSDASLENEAENPANENSELMQQNEGELLINAGEAYYLLAHENIQLQYIGNKAIVDKVDFEKSPTRIDDLYSRIIRNDNWNQPSRQISDFSLKSGNWSKIQVTSGQLKLMGLSGSVEISPCEMPIIKRVTLKEGEKLVLEANNPFSRSCSGLLYGGGSQYRAHFVVYTKDGSVKNDYEGTTDFWRPMYNGERMEISMLEGSATFYGGAEYFAFTQ